MLAERLRWSTFQQSYIDRSFELNPVFAASLGKHEFDGRLPDWTEQGIAAATEFFSKAIRDGEAMQGLNAQQDDEGDYLVADARGNLFWLQTADQPHTNPPFI